MPTDPLRLQIADGLATITLARPESNNAMDRDFVTNFSDIAATISGDRSVRAVLVDALGKNFCVGGDIRGFAAASDRAGYIEEIASRLHDGILRLTTLPVPVIIAVQGAAAGAGLSLVASGDIVIAAQSSTFTMAYSGIGLTADGGATWLLPRLIGLRRAQELAYLNRRLDSTEAERFGLVTRVVPDDRLAADAREIATRIAAGPTRAFGHVKRLFADSDSTPFAVQLDAEVQSMGAAMRTDDAANAITAFLAREKPRFRGS